MKKRIKNQALIYLRRSGEKQEASLEEQLHWAQNATAKLALSIDVTQSELQEMIAQGECMRRNVILDDGITGSDLLRPGLLKLIEVATNESVYSHMFVLNRTRLARPHHPLDVTVLEHALTSAGVTIVFSDAVAEPGLRGSASVIQSLLALMQYAQSGEYLYQLAMNVLRGQIRNAKRGGWNGGDPPYGFERALIDANGEVIEFLEPGKSIKKEGCYVDIRPYYEDKIKTWIQILTWRAEGIGYKRIAQLLNQEDIPSPDAGKIRTGNGVRYIVSGSWAPGTVRQLIQNAAIIAVYTYGTRSTGGHGRLGKDGPRELTDDERISGQQSKVTMNEEAVQTRTTAKYKPLIEPANWMGIQQLNLERSVNQRGVRRNTDPTKYPLSCRLFDLTDGCGWTLNGITLSKRKKYICGRYHKTAGHECYHNLVDADEILDTVVTLLLNKLQSYGTVDVLRKLLVQKAKGVTGKKRDKKSEVTVLNSEIKQVQIKISRLTRRLCDEDFDAEVLELLKLELNRLVVEKRNKQEQIEKLKDQGDKRQTPLSMEEEVEKSLTIIEHLSDVISSNKESIQRFQQVLVALNIRVGINFGDKTVGKRKLRQQRGGIIAIGNQDLPVPIYGRNNLETLGRSHPKVSQSIDGDSTHHGDDGRMKPLSDNSSQREEDLLPKVQHAGA